MYIYEDQNAITRFKRIKNNYISIKHFIINNNYLKNTIYNLIQLQHCDIINAISSHSAGFHFDGCLHHTYF